MREILELFYPRRCPGCDGLLESGEKKAGFCRDCERKVQLVGDTHCLKCGRPLADSARVYCPDCAGRSHFFDQGKGVFVYEGPVKTAMYRLKYSNRRCYGTVLAEIGARRYGAWLREKQCDCIIPVPMFSNKRRRRGYNQAAVLARELGRILGIPVDERAVRRVRSTRPQKGLGRAERKYNLKNAFKLWESSVKLKCILVVDDIYTTGSTMDEIARLLKEGGAGSVYCLSMSIGRGY